MNGQLSIFDAVETPQRVRIKAGDLIEDGSPLVGSRLEWLDACKMIGRVILYKQVLQSLTYYTAVIPEKHLVKTQVYYRNNERFLSDRLVCFDGTRQRSLIDEVSCGNMFYELKEAGAG